jgi:hypothetical protein
LDVVVASAVNVSTYDFVLASVGFAGVGTVTVPVNVGLALGARVLAATEASILLAKPGTVGLVAVPPRSPASWMRPLLLVVASGAPLSATPSTYALEAAWESRLGVGTAGDARNVLVPAMVSAPEICTTSSLLAFSAIVPEALMLPSEL